MRYFRPSRLNFQLTRSRLDDSNLKLLAGLATIDLLILDNWMRDGVTMAVEQIPAGYFSDRFGTRPIIFASLLLGIASSFVMVAATNP